MALKRRHALLGSSKGILLTLFTIVLFILMLSELVTYVVLNINYGNLETQAGRASSTGSMVQDINSSLSTFLQSSLSGALSGLTYYESTPSVRKDSFINSTSTALATIMETGAYNSYSLSGYEGTTLSQYITALTKQASSQGASISITNGTLSVFQGGAFAIMASYTAMLTVNQSGAISNYPIDAIASVSTAARQYLPGAEQGIPSTLVPGTSSPNATLVGNIYAKAGSTSPYMFAYGTVVYYPGEPNCGTIASGYKSSSYILATPDAADIGRSVCGMAGLVANAINASTPIMPYLLYNNASIMSYLQNSPSLLLDGQGLALLNTTPLQQAVQSGAAYASPYMPTYLQRAQSSLFSSSPNGFYTFSPLNVKVAQFNGQSSVTIGNSGTINSPANAITMVGWFNVASFSKDSNYPSPLDKEGQYGIYLHPTGVECDISPSWNGNTGPSQISTGTWYFFACTYNGSDKMIYLDGNLLASFSATGAISPNSNNLGIGVGGNFAYSDYAMYGNEADIQIYNTTLSPSEISTLYREGMSGMPISNAGLVGWWPLNGNATDMSGQGNSGTASNVIYAAPSGYTFDPLSNHVPGESTSHAAQFNGASSYITTNYVQTAATSYTIVAWIRTTKGSLQAVVQDRGSGAGHSLTLGFNNCGAPSGGIFFADDLNNVAIGVSNATPLDNGAWYMVAGTFNAPSGTSISPSQFTLYINGKPASATGSCAYGSDTSPLTGLGGTVIGYHQAWNVYFNGSIVNVQVYNSTLSTAQVSQLYREGISGGPISDAELTGWWPLDGNANDYSGNGNNGVATNVIYTSLLNSPTANLVEGVLNCANLDQCSNTTLQHLYLNPLPLEHAGMGFMNETTSLGMMNAALPDALSFNGISDYVSASGNPISGTGAFTLTAWIDAQPMSNYGGAFTIGSPSSGESAYIGYVTGAQAGASNSIGGGLYGTNIGSGVTSKGWHFVALTFSGGTSGSLILYVDGVEKTSTSATPDITGTSMLIGTIQSNTYFFNGSVADVQLYNSALSTPQVQQLYLNNSVPGVAPIDYWPLGSGMNSLLNETPDIVGGKTGYFYGNGAACTNSQVVNGQCGPSYTPP